MAERGVFAAELQLEDRGCHDARSTASILSRINRINDQDVRPKVIPSISFLVIHPFVSYAPDPISLLELSTAMMSSTSKAKKQSNPPRATSGSTHQDTPPDSPPQVLTANAITSNHVQQFLDILKQATSESEPTSGADPSVEKHDGKKDRVRASKFDFTTVNQMYAPCSPK